MLYAILERSDLKRDSQRLPANSTCVGKSTALEVLLRKVRMLPR